MKVKVKKNILSANDAEAAEIRLFLKKNNLRMVNVMASPGAGKTSLILALLSALKDRVGELAVIEGDVAGSIDTVKIKKAGFKAVQINTGGGCHLSAQMIQKALKELNLVKVKSGLIFVENIGNLICPAEFDLGAEINLVMTSVPEGDDKAVKYPGIFQVADIIVINKIDLLPYLNFGIRKFMNSLRTINPKAPVITLSALKGKGLDELVEKLAG